MNRLSMDVRAKRIPTEMKDSVRHFRKREGNKVEG